ncbi:ATP/GTP-binding protein [Xylariaceae sp. FL1019]|nr:ATP/GTP-binding protein [Xylariaceae sp. FL1019]
MMLKDTVARLWPEISRSGGDPRPVVVMMCGIAGSGKSTLAKTIVSMHPNFECISGDGIVAEKHGIYGVDYAPEMYSDYLDEAWTESKSRLTQVLSREPAKDVVLDRAFWNKQYRNEAKAIIKGLQARWVLVYLKAPSKEILWERIQARRKAEINADSAYEITQDILATYWNGFEEPSNEGEIVVHTARGYPA